MDNEQHGKTERSVSAASIDFKNSDFKSVKNSMGKGNMYMISGYIFE